MKCPVFGCKKDIQYGRQTCEMHYMRMRRNGDYFTKKAATRKIEFDVTENGCFEVTSHTQVSNGYFLIGKHGQRKSMHRHVYEECFGPIPDNLFVCHKCDNKQCINPEHLELGTHLKNVQDAVNRGRYRVGSRHVHSKLTEDEVRQMRKLLLNGARNVDVARLFNIDNDTVSDIKRRKSWKHVN